MGILDEIKKQQAERKALGIHATIPLVKDEKGIGVDEDLAKKPADVVELPKTQSPSPEPISGSPKPKVNLLRKPGSGVTSAPKPVISYGSKPTPGKSLTPIKASPVAQTLEKKKALPTLAEVSDLMVKEDTFDRGIEKYTDKEVEAIKVALDMLENSFSNKEAVGSALKVLMGSINANPNLRETLKPRDIGTMVRAIRESYGVHVAKADARATKKESKAKVVSEIDSLLDGLDLS